VATFADFAQNIMPDVKWLDDYKRLRNFEKQLRKAEGPSPNKPSGYCLMEQPRVIGYVVAINEFRLKVELLPDSKSSSRATPEGVQCAIVINSFLTFDLGAGLHAIGILSDLEERESFDPVRYKEAFAGVDEATLDCLGSASGNRQAFGEKLLEA